MRTRIFFKKIAFTALITAVFLANSVFYFGSPVEAAVNDERIHVGHATKIVFDVHSQGENQETVKLFVDDQVFFEESMITLDDSVAVLQFRDGSTLELGPNAIIKLDMFVFNPFENASSKSLTLLRGSFRYVSGFAAKDSKIQIKTPVGTMGIRGSTGSGFYYPGTPLFMHVSKGEGDFSNNAGSSAIGSGQSIGADNPDLPPMSSDVMPAAVAAEALRYIQRTVGPASTFEGTKKLSPKQRAADAAANAVPLSLQKKKQQGTAQQKVVATGDIKSPATAKKNTSAAPELPLLAAAKRVGLFQVQTKSKLNQAQQKFVKEVKAANPRGAEQVAAVNKADRARNRKNVEGGTKVVVTGTSENAKDASKIEKLVATVVATNPDLVKEAVAAAVSGGSKNKKIGSVEKISRLVSQTAIISATKSGAKVEDVTKAITEGAIDGAKEAGGNVEAAVEASTKGLFEAAGKAGIKTSSLKKAITSKKGKPAVLEAKLAAVIQKVAGDAEKAEKAASEAEKKVVASKKTARQAKAKATASPTTAPAPEQNVVADGNVVDGDNFQVETVAGAGDQATVIDIERLARAGEQMISSGNKRMLIEFRDGSVLEIGRNTKILLGPAIFNLEEGISQKSFKVIAGAFRYTSGLLGDAEELRIITENGQAQITRDDVAEGKSATVIEGLVDPDATDFFFVRSGTAEIASNGTEITATAGNSILLQTSAEDAAPANIPNAIALKVINRIDGLLGNIADFRLVEEAAITEDNINQLDAVNKLSVDQQTGIIGSGQAILVGNILVSPDQFFEQSDELGFSVGELVDALSLGIFGGGELNSEQVAFLEKLGSANADSAIAALLLSGASAGEENGLRAVEAIIIRAIASGNDDALQIIADSGLIESDEQLAALLDSLQDIETASGAQSGDETPPDTDTPPDQPESFLLEDTAEIPPSLTSSPTQT